MRPGPNPSVVDWLDELPSGSVWTSAITRAEIELGIALLPDGRRRTELQLKAEALFEEDFAGRCLSFDDVAAKHYGSIVAARTRAGKPISVEDAQIAAIAVSHKLALATRNVADFTGIEGLSVSNPWDLQRP